MTGKHAGRKQDGRELSEKSYSIYNSCYECPLKVYIDIVCNNNLNSLIIAGNPSEEILSEAFNRIMSEYAELSGNSVSTKYNILLKEIYSYRAQILGLIICMRLLCYESSGEAIESLNKLGLRCSPPTDQKAMEDLLQKIDLRIKDRSIRMEKSKKEFSRIKESSKTQNVSPRDFIEQLSCASRWAGFRISTDITLAEYAVYIKQMSEYAEQLKAKTNGKKYQ